MQCAGLNPFSGLPQKIAKQNFAGKGATTPHSLRLRLCERIKAKSVATSASANSAVSAYSAARNAGGFILFYFNLTPMSTRSLTGKLGIVQSGIETVVLYKLFVRALFYDIAVFHYKY